MNKQKKAYIFAVSTVVLWATVASAFKLTLSYIGVYELLFFSSLTSTLLLFGVLIFNSGFQSFRIKSKDLLVSSVLGFLNPFLYYIVLFKAYSLLPAQEAQSLNYSWGITVAIVAAIVLKQKLSLLNVIGLLVSFFGLIIVATRGDLAGLEFSNTNGVILAVGSSIIWAFYWIGNINDDREPIEKLFWNFLFGTVYIAILLIIRQDLTINLNGIIGSIYIGIAEMGLAFIFWFKAMKLSSSAGKISNLIYLSPILSLFIISYSLGEQILPATIIGLVFILSGIVISNLKKRD